MESTEKRTQLDILDAEFLDNLANEAADHARVVPNVTWRVHYEQLAAAARALANARLRARVGLNAVGDVERLLKPGEARALSGEAMKRN